MAGRKVGARAACKSDGIRAGRWGQAGVSGVAKKGLCTLIGNCIIINGETNKHERSTERKEPATHFIFV